MKYDIQESKDNSDGYHPLILQKRWVKSGDSFKKDKR